MVSEKERSIMILCRCIGIVSAYKKGIGDCTMEKSAKEKQRKQKWKSADLISFGGRLLGSERMASKTSRFLVSMGITVLLLGLCTGLAFLMFHNAGDGTANIALIYTLGLIFTTLNTEGYGFGLLFAVFSVICINFFFSFPYFEPNFTMTGYPVTFLVMLIIFFITSTITTRLKQQSRLLVEREKLLMEAEKEKMRANLLRAVSHDLRTPLTGIIGASSSYLENEKDLSRMEKRELVQNIQSDADWLLHMVENLLSVTRINTRTANVTKSLESVEEVVSEAVIQIKKRLPGAEIRVRVPEEVLMIQMDAILIQQVIMNLLENAIIHAKSTRPIELVVKREGETVSFHVIDYGIGIPEERLQSLFDGSTYEPAGRVDGSKGMGIGLSICKTICLAHGGTIDARNHANGADFYFTLPAEE